LWLWVEIHLLLHAFAQMAAFGGGRSDDALRFSAGVFAFGHGGLLFFSFVATKKSGESSEREIEQRGERGYGHSIDHVEDAADRPSFSETCRHAKS
jgi:hypothetical protein